MRSPRGWKDTFRDGMYRCTVLREHKVQRNLLEFIVHKAHSKLQACWVSQREMAEVFGCNERNVKKLLVGLQEVGAVLPVRFSALPPKDQKAINALSPRPLNNNSNVYYPCLGWAEDMLRHDASEPSDHRGNIAISEVDRRRGSKRASEKHRRYAPIETNPARDVATHPDHDDYLFMNAVGGKAGHSGAPFSDGNRGTSSTRISTENHQAANSAPNNGQNAAAGAPSSQEKISTPYRSLLTSQPADPIPHGFGAGEAGAQGQGTKFLAGLGGAHESTEYDTASARANDRRVS